MSFGLYLLPSASLWDIWIWIPSSVKIKLKVINNSILCFCSFEADKNDREILDILTHGTRYNHENYFDMIKCIIINKNRYDKRNKPPQQHIGVNISVLLLSLSSPSESSLVTFFNLLTVEYNFFLPRLMKLSFWCTKNG